MYSEYLQKLLLETPDVGERYKEKIKLINDVDPFTLEDGELSFMVDDFPKIEFVDIVAYLVFTHSFYAKEQIKAHKSLASYKYLESGFVIKTGYSYQVKHSQMANAKSLETCIIADKHGNVSASHCTCMEVSKYVVM